MFNLFIPILVMISIITSIGKLRNKNSSEGKNRRGKMAPGGSGRQRGDPSLYTGGVEMSTENSYTGTSGASVYTGMTSDPNMGMSGMIPKNVGIDPSLYSSGRQAKGAGAVKRKYRDNTARSEAKFRRLEDRENDWLARQMREEAKWKRNSCFDPAAELKRSHAEHCDARSLAREHAVAHRKGRY